MSCSRMQSLLSSFIDDELGPKETQILLLHLRDCPSCGEALEELRTLQQLHKRVLAHKGAPVSSLAFTRRVMAAVQREDTEAEPAPAEMLPSWRLRALWETFAHGKRWIAVPIAAAAAALLIVVLNPLSSPERDLRLVSELQATATDVAAEPDDKIEHYLTEYGINVVQPQLAGAADSIQFVSYQR